MKTAKNPLPPKIGNTADAFKKVEEKARKLNSALRADDKRFERISHVVHQDGSTILMQNAFLMEASANGIEFVVMLAEHHMPQIFAQDDIESWAQYERVSRRGIINQGDNGVEFMK